MEQISQYHFNTLTKPQT